MYSLTAYRKIVYDPAGEEILRPACHFRERPIVSLPEYADLDSAPADPTQHHIRRPGDLDLERHSLDGKRRTAEASEKSRHHELVRRDGSAAASGPRHKLC